MMGSNKNRGGPNPGLLLALIGLVWLFWPHHQNPKETQHSTTTETTLTPDQEINQVRQENLTKLRAVTQTMGTLTLQGEVFSFRDTIKVHSGDKSLFMMEVWLKPDSFTFIYDVTCAFELMIDISKSQVYLDRDLSKTAPWLELPRFQSRVTIHSVVTQEQGFWSAQNWYTTSDEILAFDNEARVKLRSSTQSAGEALIPQRNLSDAWISLKKEVAEDIRGQMSPVEVTIY